MKWSKMMIQTLREDPGDAEIDSHKLLVRASLVKKVSGGLYTYLPLGTRSLRKVERIIREEMVTDLARGVVSSYRQLPATLYQIQWKFRDEIRPRFGDRKSVV